MVITAFQERDGVLRRDSDAVLVQDGPDLGQRALSLPQHAVNAWLRNTAIIGSRSWHHAHARGSRGLRPRALSGRIARASASGSSSTTSLPPTLLFLPLYWVINTLHQQDKLWP